MLIYEEEANEEEKKSKKEAGKKRNNKHQIILTKSNEIKEEKELDKNNSNFIKEKSLKANKDNELLFSQREKKLLINKFLFSFKNFFETIIILL